MTVRGLGVDIKWQDFVKQLCALGVKNTSKEIADIINSNSTITVTSMQVAGVKSSYTKMKNKEF